jgi:hypothetical protein
MGNRRHKRAGLVPQATTKLTWAMEVLLHAGFLLLSQQQHHRTVLPEAHAGNQTPKLLPPAGLVLQSRL